jgi:hypothetical protein
MIKKDETENWDENYPLNKWLHSKTKRRSPSRLLGLKVVFLVEVIMLVFYERFIVSEFRF